MNRLDTVPRYEVHLAVMGVVCCLIDAEGTQILSPPLGYRSVATALKRIDQLARRDVKYNFDYGIGWAPA